MEANEVKYPATLRERSMSLFQVRIHGFQTSNQESMRFRLQM